VKMPQIAPLVFVSSTRDDLSDYRDAILRSFPALDVLYRGTEFFGARPLRAHDVILEELLECDLYLGILGHRYGAIDPVSGVSFTETEYRTAKEAKIPTIFFLMDDSQKIYHGAIDKDLGNARKLENFKKTVSAETVFQHFTTPDDLVGKVGRSLQTWLDERKSHLRQLRYRPVDEFENENIRKLYYKSPGDVVHAIQRVNFDCRAANEHFYGLLYRCDLHVDIVDAIFDRLKHFADNDRFCQMLLNIIADLRGLRPQAINAIGGRAIIHERFVDDQLIKLVFDLAKDGDEDVRDEVAHALSKIGANYPTRLSQCRELLEKLETDSSQKVRDRATKSLQRLPNKLVRRQAQ